MLNYKENICPRCFGAIPNNAVPGMYIGALSRVDNETYICSPCGEEEALVALIRQDEWPIVLFNHPATVDAQHRFRERLELQEIHLDE